MSDAGNNGPVAYLITFRTYGTWLHGDERGSVDRRTNLPGTAVLEPEPARVSFERFMRLHPPVRLDASRRGAVRFAIESTVAYRAWALHALNVRTNHVHAVVAAPGKPEYVVGAFKSNATRVMRERGVWRGDWSPWSDGGSTRYLWDEHAVAMAVDYVLNRQGPDLP